MPNYLTLDNYNKLRTIVDPETGQKPKPEIINRRIKLLDDEVKFENIKSSALSMMREQGIDDHVLTEGMIVNTVCQNRLPEEGETLEDYTRTLVQRFGQYGGSVDIKRNTRRREDNCHL